MRQNIEALSKGIASSAGASVRGIRLISRYFKNLLKYEGAKKSKAMCVNKYL